MHRFVTTRGRWIIGCAAAFGVLSAGLAWGSSGSREPAEQETAHTNLQVLPADVERSHLIDVMIENLAGLGLPRRDNTGCLYCHVGDMDTPRDEWDYASDAKVEKRKAREMMAMVDAINERLGGLEARVAPDLRVTCASCHAGRTDPRPLREVLLAAHGEGGIDRLIERYRQLRERYFGADAYDFRPFVLTRLAGDLTLQEQYDDAIALAELNLEFYPDDATAHLGAFQIEVLAVDARDGVDGVIAAFEGFRSGPRAEWATYRVLDSHGWTIYRRGREDDTRTLFRRNLETFPDEYIPHESMADWLRFDGDVAGAMRLYESWLERHPDHDVARRRLMNLRESES